MAKWRTPLAAVRSTTVGIISLTALWAGFQIFDSSPPPVLDQILVAAFGVWFATEAKRHNSKSDREDDDE